MNLTRYISLVIINSLLTLSITIGVTGQETTAGQSSEQPAQSEQKQQTQKTVAKPFPDNIPLEDQYIYLIEKSSTYQDYRVIRQAWVSKFKTHFLDTLKFLRGTIIDDQSVISQKTYQIDSLANELKKTNNILANVVKEKNSLKLFGFQVSKQAYDAIMWLIIIGLLALVGFLFMLFKRSNTITIRTKTDLQEIKDEFEDFRKKALKSKEEAVRMIYDELKKYKK